MISAWTKHLKTEEEKAKFKNTVLGSKLVLNRLQDIVNEIEQDLDNTELNTKIYDIPNWDYRQADMNGFRRAIKTIKKIITIEPQTNG